jgi:hypothetical protein
MAGRTNSLTQINALLDQKNEAIGELEHNRLVRLHQEATCALSRLKSNHSRFEEAYGEGKRQFRNILDDLRGHLYLVLIGSYITLSPG